MMSNDDVVISMLETFGIPRPKQQRSLDTYHRVLRSAQQCVAELGYSKTSTQEVANRADLSHGGLFKRFPTKVSLMASMVGYLQAEARKRAEEECPPELVTSSTRDKVSFFIEWYWQFVQTQEFKAIDEVWDEARTDQQLLEALKPILASDVVAGDLAHLFPKLDNSTEIQFLSQMIYSSLEYLAFNHGMGVDEDAPEKLEFFIDLVCREIDRLQEKK